MTRTLIARVSGRLSAAALALVLTAGAMLISQPNAVAVEPAVANTASYTAAAAAPTRLTSFDQKMIALMNEKRTAAGLVPLKEAKGLTSLSVWWSTQLANGTTGYALEHNPNATKMLPSYGASNWSSWAENVARWKPNTVTAQSIFDAYWASPGHKANIMGASSRYIGMGSVTGSTGWSFNTMTFTDKVESGQVAPAAVKPAVKAHMDKVTVKAGTMKLVGWTFSPNKPSLSNSVTIKVTGSKGTITYKRSTNVTRADVNRIYGLTGKHGFNSSIPLQPGTNKVCVTAIAFTGATNVAMGCWTGKK